MKNVSKKVEKSASKSMGVPPLAGIVFARKFRWTLKGKYISEQFMKTVKFDHKNQIITFECYDVVGVDVNFDALIWANNIKEFLDESLVFTTYDGCGNKLYQIEFAGLDLVSHDASFDYEDKSISFRTIVVRYQQEYVKLENGLSKVPNYTWKMKIGKKEFNVIASRPQIKIDEVNLSHLNASAMIPGKAKWSPISITFLEPITIMPLFNQQKVEILTYRNNVLVDVHTYLDAWTSYTNDMCWTLNFSEVEYDCI